MKKYTHSYVINGGSALGLNFSLQKVDGYVPFSVQSVDTSNNSVVYRGFGLEPANYLAHIVLRNYQPNSESATAFIDVGYIPIM